MGLHFIMAATNPGRTAFFVNMENVDMQFVFRTHPGGHIDKFVDHIGLHGNVHIFRTEIMNDCTILTIKRLPVWNPTHAIKLPDLLVGGVITFNAGCDLNLIANTFPCMYYKIEEFEHRVTVGVCRHTAVFESTPTSLLSVQMHFRGELAMCIDTLFDDACIETRVLNESVCRLSLKSGEPWKFARRLSIPENLQTVVLIYMSDEHDVFSRIHDDIAAAFPGMHAVQYRDGCMIQILLTREAVDHDN